MDKRRKTTEDIMRDWIAKALEVPHWKRHQFMQMMKAGSTVGEARAALDLPLMVAAQIIIEDFETVEGGS